MGSDPQVQNKLEVLATATAVNGAPSAAGDGVAMMKSAGRVANTLLDMTVTGAGSITYKYWGYIFGKWYDLNTSFTETGTTNVNYADPVFDMSSFSRIYAEVTAISGTTATANISLGLVG